MGESQGRRILEQLEQQLSAGRVRIRIKGLLRPLIVLESVEGGRLGEIRAGPILDHWPHQARCRLFGTALTLEHRGFREQSLSLLLHGRLLLRVSHGLLSSLYSIQDAEGMSWEFRASGPPWRRRFRLAGDPPRDDVVQFRFFAARPEPSLSIAPPAGATPGVTAGAALLLFYSAYLSLRAGFLSIGGAGGS